MLISNNILLLNSPPFLFPLHVSEYDKVMKKPAAVLDHFSNIEPVLRYFF